MNKKLLFAVVIAAAILMPYLARLPLTLTRGAGWLYQYTPSVSAVVFFSAFNLLSLLPLVFAGILFITNRATWTFYIGAAVYLTAMFFFNFDYDLTADAQAAIALLVFPFIAAFFTFVGAAIAFVVERRLLPGKKKF
jgi:hypothetical protein